MRIHFLNHRRFLFGARAVKRDFVSACNVAKLDAVTTFLDRCLQAINLLLLLLEADEHVSDSSSPAAKLATDPQVSALKVSHANETFAASELQRQQNFPMSKLIERTLVSGKDLTDLALASSEGKNPVPFVLAVEFGHFITFHNHQDYEIKSKVQLLYSSLLEVAINCGDRDFVRTCQAFFFELIFIY